jgi:cold shock CspA family protein
MAHGVLKWFNQASDYGFIACDDGSPDRYVRGENVTRGASIAAGSRMQFEPREGGMGPEATNVRERSTTRHPRIGRIEPSRRHGPFDPRFSPRPNAARLLATSNDPRVAREHANTDGPRRQKEAVQDWESEGGAIAELPRANPTAQAA